MSFHYCWALGTSASLAGHLKLPAFNANSPLKSLQLNHLLWILFPADTSTEAQFPFQNLLNGEFPCKKMII